MQSTVEPQTITQNQGIFGFGLSHNNQLDLLNIIVLACAGIFIKMFFQENYSKLGNIGPASTTIWGYGLTSIALIILIFMGIYFIDAKSTSSKIALFESPDSDSIFNKLTLFASDVLPILFTLCIIIYIIVLNFIYFTRINSNRVTDNYHTYSLMSSILLIIQLALIFKYMFSYLGPQKDNKNELIKNATYILTTVNLIFVLIIHIVLAFFSTDG
jgi:hypothetical protein